MELKKLLKLISRKKLRTSTEFPRFIFPTSMKTCLVKNKLNTMSLITIIYFLFLKIERNFYAIDMLDRLRGRIDRRRTNRHKYKDKRKQSNRGKDRKKTKGDTMTPT